MLITWLCCVKIPSPKKNKWTANPTIFSFIWIFNMQLRFTEFNSYKIK